MRQRARTRYIVSLLWLALLLTALPARALSPLVISLTLSRDDVRAGQTSLARTTLTIGIFSTGEMTTTARLQLPIDTARLHLTSGIVQSGLGGHLIGAKPGDPTILIWQGPLRVDSPALLVLTFQARPDAPPGDITLTAVAVDTAGHTAQASATLRVCCVEWPPPERPKVYLPAWRA